MRGGHHYRKAARVSRPPPRKPGDGTGGSLTGRRRAGLGGSGWPGVAAGPASASRGPVKLGTGWGRPPGWAGVWRFGLGAVGTWDFQAKACSLRKWIPWPPLPRAGGRHAAGYEFGRRRGKGGASEELRRSKMSSSGHYQESSTAASPAPFPGPVQPGDFSRPIG